MANTQRIVPGVLSNFAQPVMLFETTSNVTRMVVGGGVTVIETSPAPVAPSGGVPSGLLLLGVGT